MKRILYLLIICPLTVWAQNSNDHLSLKMDFRPDSTVQIEATYKVASLQSDTVFFALNPGVKISSIKADGLEKHSLGMQPNRPFPYIRLHFADRVEAGDPMTVNFQYVIDLKTTNHIKSNWLEFNADKLWYPNYNDIDNAFTWDLEITNLYRNYSVVSYEFDERIRYRTFMDPGEHLTLTQKEPTPEVYLMMGPDMQLWQPTGTSRSRADISIFAHEDVPEEQLSSIGEKVDDLIHFYNRQFGKSNEISRYLVVVRNTSDINFLQSRGEILLSNQGIDDYASLSHEVSHYWWSFADFLTEPWMNESFANYSMLVALEEFDKDAFSTQVDRIRHAAQAEGSVRNAGTFPGANFPLYYFKGAKLLWDLDQKIGRKAMMKLLEERAQSDIHDTEGFLDLLEEQEGRAIRDEFEARL